MSTLVVKGNASGSGTITVEGPNTNSNFTVSIPAATTTLVGTDSTDTLTNKTLTSPTLTTPVINSATISTVSGSAPLFLCRAWVNFNGTGVVAIRASGNVSSITDNGVGQYVVNLANALPDADYTVVSSCSVVGSYPLFCNIHSTSPWSTQTPTTTAFAVNAPNGVLTGFGDPLYFSVAVFR